MLTMSKYTTEVRYIVESIANEEITPNNIDAITAMVGANIFGTMPPEMYGGEGEWVSLCSRILQHYITREIGFETVGLWKLKVRAKLREILPYYKELYQTTLYDIDPTRTVDFEVVRQRTFGNEGTSNTSRSNSSDFTSKYSDTPQGGINGLVDGNYLTSAEINNTNENGNANTTDSRSGNDNETVRTTGKEGGVSYATLIKEYRQTIINIEMMIVEELKDYFMLIW